MENINYLADDGTEIVGKFVDELIEPIYDHSLKQIDETGEFDSREFLEKMEKVKNGLESDEILMFDERAAVNLATLYLFSRIRKFDLEQKA